MRKDDIRAAKEAFKPVPRHKPEKSHVLVEFTPDDYEDLKFRAKSAGVSIKDYCRQAIAYAMAQEGGQ
jgi:hypothetical protein